MYFEVLKNIISDKEIYSRELLLVTELNLNIAEKIGDSEVYISEFIIAKIKGYIKNK